MSKEAEKLARDCEESADIWANEIDTRRKAAALLRRQAEQIRGLRELIDGVLKIGRGTSGRIILEGWHEETLRAALSNTKEAE